MLERLEIKNFRGVKTGAVDGFFPLTVMIGPNGSGKSTVLEAAYLLLNRPHELEGTLRQVLASRGWLGTTSAVSALGNGNAPSRFTATANGAPASTKLAADVMEGVVLVQWTWNGHNGGCTIQEEEKAPVLPSPDSPCRWVGTQVAPAELSALFNALNAGGWEKIQPVVPLLQQVFPGMKDLRPLPTNLAQTQYAPFLLLGQGRVPLMYVGNGGRRLAQLAFNLALGRGQTVLVEEPEAFQHPGSLAMVVRMIWEAVEQGTQVILATHSLELLDLLRAEARPGVAWGVLRTRLDEEGTLKTWRVEGDRVDYFRDNLLEDLR